ncbi:MAG: hypothetical protein PHG02_05755 [Oscillospiraceae bacterium]|nr:hypothetical protein [Oscillospiraceae bacterium]
MEVLKKLKQISIKNVLVKAFAFIAAGVILFVAFGGVNFVKAKLKGPTDIYELSVDELEGAYVSAEVYFLFDMYAYTEETKDGVDTGKILNKEYIIPVGEQEYMGVSLPSAYLQQADTLLEECNTYFTNGTSPTISFVVEGTILPMEADSLSFYHDMVGYNNEDATPEYQALFLPYYLKADTIGTYEVGTLYMVVAASVILIGVGLYMLLRALVGGYQSKMKKIVSAQENSELLWDELEKFYENTEPVNGIRISENWILYQKGANSVLLWAKDIVWAYQSTTTHRMYGIPTGKTYCVVLRTGEGKQYQIAVKTETMAQDVIRQLEDKLLGVTVGYTAEIVALYNTDRESFVKRRQEGKVNSEVF